MGYTTAYGKYCTSINAARANATQHNEICGYPSASIQILSSSAKRKKKASRPQLHDSSRNQNRSLLLNFLLTMECRAKDKEKRNGDLTPRLNSPACGPHFLFIDRAGYESNVPAGYLTPYVALFGERLDPESNRESAVP
ncbi:hypothetical protein B0H13DRAFT_1865961 [Mycena leptocephala]|nr:hypothetical protein B0H13DRAFT_1865961 [Mycena leptocephala]